MKHTEWIDVDTIYAYYLTKEKASKHLIISTRFET